MLLVLFLTVSFLARGVPELLVELSASTFVGKIPIIRHSFVPLSVHAALRSKQVFAASMNGYALMPLSTVSIVLSYN